MKQFHRLTAFVLCLLTFLSAITFIPVQTAAKVMTPVLEDLFESESGILFSWIQEDEDEDTMYHYQLYKLSGDPDLGIVTRELVMEEDTDNPYKLILNSKFPDNNWWYQFSVYTKRNGQTSDICTKYFHYSREGISISHGDVTEIKTGDDRYVIEKDWWKSYNPSYDSRITPDAIEKFLQATKSVLRKDYVVYGDSQNWLYFTKTKAKTGETEEFKIDLGFTNYFSENHSISLSVLGDEDNAVLLTPAEIIYYACKEDSMDVVWILAKLQHEQSLVGKLSRSIANQARMDCAMGYLHNRTKGEPNYGFFGQVLAGTWQFWAYANKKGKSNYEAFNTYTPTKNKKNVYSDFNEFYEDYYLEYAAIMDQILASVQPSDIVTDIQIVHEADVKIYSPGAMSVNTNGLKVIANYTNGTYQVIPHDQLVCSADLSKLGNTKVSVCYTHYGQKFYTEYAIAVSDIVTPSDTDSDKIKPQETSTYVRDEDSDILYGIRENTKLSKLLFSIINETEYIAVYDEKGERVTDSKDIVGTGWKIELQKKGEAVDSVYIAVTGDLNGDGKSGLADIKQVLSAAVGNIELTQVQTLAADRNGDKKASITDAKKLLKEYMDKQIEADKG